MAIDRRAFLQLSTAALIPSPEPSGIDQRGSSPTAAHDSSFDPWLEVRPDHLAHNATEVARLAGGRPIFAVIKNNGYGLGLVPVARALASSRPVRGLAVVKLHEALTLRDAGVKAP